jgi:hypothetical protein
MPQSSKTFRIFVSSTFSDLKEERNALQRKVFPKLRDLCRQNGFRFQAIDLRWGVREEAALDQQTVRICLDEIARCQQTTPRPNFIVLLGNRYGWQPLPYVIEASEFEALNSHVSGKEDQKLLGTWYKRDDNNVPVMYCLQPRIVEVPKGKSEEEIRKIREKESEAWQQIEKKLQKLLRSAVEKISLKDDQLIKYHASATEQEIITGTLIVPDAKEHVFGFFREISDLPRNEKARDYTDLDPKNAVDKEAQTKLGTLKKRLETKIGKDNIFQYQAKWTGQGITTDHLNKLCEDVYSSLAGVIQQSIQQLEEKDPLEQEIDAHAYFGLDRARVFIGRIQPLKTIQDYIVRTDPHPLAIWGESGTGKSALMAKAVKQVEKYHSESVLIARFIGATPDSSDGRSLLESLCRQIVRSYSGDETAVPSDYKELIEIFPKQLELATKDKPLILFLDAMDQLSDANNARNLVWLPSELPHNVRMIVSTIPGECLDALNKLPNTSRIQLEPMPAGEGEELLDIWLKDAGRTLQKSQKKIVLDHFVENGLPLYLKLAFEEAKRWKSYLSQIQLNPDIPGLIRDLFARLSSETNHGEMMVSRSLSYMAAGKNGLSEDELIDVLSRDKEVFEDFKKRSYHQPPEQRLPVVVWSRLYFDLEPYLSERTADGASLITFYHRQLGEVVVEDYFSDKVKKDRHQALAVYFGEQPLFTEKDAEKIPNLRKLSELPFQQTGGEMWDAVYETLTDFEFLEAKCTHMSVTTAGSGEEAQKVYSGVYDLLEDYRRSLEKYPAS